MLQAHLKAIEKLLVAQSQIAKNAGHPNLRGGPREYVEGIEMKVDIYKTKNRPSLDELCFVFVPMGFEIENLPVDVKKTTGNLYFQQQMDLERGERRIGMFSDQTLEEIEKIGYSLQSVKVGVRVNTAAMCA